MFPKAFCKAVVRANVSFGKEILFVFVVHARGSCTLDPAMQCLDGLTPFSSLSDMYSNRAYVI